MSNEGHALSTAVRRFEEFCGKVSYKTARIGGVEWKYMDIGNQGGKVIIFFAGGLRHPLWSFSLLDLFVDEYRVVAPCYPPIGDLDSVLDGIRSILDTESVSHSYMMGSSWGGSMVQCFTYKYPDAADRIVLSNTGSVYSKLMIPALKLHRMSIARKSRDKVLSDYKKKILQLWSKPPEYAPFWADLIERYYTALFSYKDYVALIDNQVDYLERYAFSLIDRPTYMKPTLIISSEDETASTKKVRDKVRDLYQNHTYHEFKVGGHAVALSNPEEFRRLVCEFLDPD